MDDWGILAPVSNPPRAMGFLESPLGLQGAGWEKALVSPCRLCPDSQALGQDLQVFPTWPVSWERDTLCSRLKEVFGLTVRAGGGGRARAGFERVQSFFLSLRQAL